MELKSAEEFLKSFPWLNLCFRYEMLGLFFRLLSQNVNMLFNPPIVEEELINLIGNCVFRILENPSIAHQRMKDVRLSLIQVLGLLMSKYSYSLSCRLKIVQSLKHFEHLAVSLTSFLHVKYQDIIKEWYWDKFKVSTNLQQMAFWSSATLQALYVVTKYLYPIDDANGIKLKCKQQTK